MRSSQVLQTRFTIDQSQTTTQSVSSTRKFFPKATAIRTVMIFANMRVLLINTAPYTLMWNDKVLIWPIMGLFSCRYLICISVLKECCSDVQRVGNHYQNEKLPKLDSDLADSSLWQLSRSVLYRLTTEQRYWKCTGRQISALTQ